MAKLSIRTWHDVPTLEMVIQLHDQFNYVEARLSAEQMADAVNYKALIVSTLEELALKWQAEFGRQVSIQQPTHEAETYRAYYTDDVIDGEIVEERRAIDAPRKAIEGW